MNTYYTALARRISPRLKAVLLRNPVFCRLGLPIIERLRGDAEAAPTTPEPPPTPYAVLPHLAPEAKPKVSVVMPVYNGANYLRQALDSVVAQDYANLEIIVVNDGSTDDTGEIVASYDDSRIVYIEKPNGGVASALNAGIDAMTSDYFCWLSHDDVYLPHKVARQLDHYLANFQGETVVLCCDYDLIDKDGALIQPVVLNHAQIAEKPAYAILRGQVHGCSVFLPRRMFDEVGRFDTSLPTTQDYDLWSRALERYRFVHMDETLIQSRWHDEQGSKTSDNTSEFNALWITLMERIPAPDKIALEGSRYKFYTEMRGFLSQAGAHAAAEFARRQTATILADIKVSVVIPFHSGIDDLRAAVSTVLSQTHPNIEILIVYDRAETDPSAALPQEHAGRNIRLLQQTKTGAAAARNLGIQEAEGEYVAFLDADDLFLPDKITRQLGAMIEHQASFAHTSYFAYSSDPALPSALRASGKLSGHLFPDILSNCPIAAPTVMARTEFLRDGYLFDEQAHLCEDVLLWMRIAQDHEILGIDEPLSVVRISSESAAYQPEKQRTALTYMLSRLEQDPATAAHHQQLAVLRAALADCERKVQRGMAPAAA